MARSSITLAEQSQTPNREAEEADPEEDVERGSITPPVSEGTIRGADQEKAGDDKYLINTLDAEDDPKQFSTARKWLAVIIISSGSVCATCASSIAAFAEVGVEKSLNTSHEVSILAISLFVIGLGFGPLLVGPLSEIYGRNPIYRVSYAVFFAFSFPVAFAPNITVFLVFRFLTGLCGAAFLSVAGGSLSDLFTNEQVATPMSVYTVSPFLGPVLGPLISGFINQNTNWRWTYRLLIIWTFVVFALLFLIPETYAPILYKRKARRLRESTGDPKYYAPLERSETTVAKAIKISCYRPFQLIIYEHMVLLLNAWNALILGILYLTFQAFPVIFRKHNFNDQEIGLTFLGIGIGMGISLSIQPYFNRMYVRRAREHDGHPPPEMYLIQGQIGAVLAPAALFWLAFTTYRNIHWIVPIIASIQFGSGIVFIFTSSWTYLVVLYRPWAASVMASNSFMRSSFAAGFPLFAGQMYRALGTDGATALLAGLCTLAAPLPFIFYRMGPRLRAKSRYAS